MCVVGGRWRGLEAVSWSLNYFKREGVTLTLRDRVWEQLSSSRERSEEKCVFLRFLIGWFEGVTVEQRI